MMKKLVDLWNKGVCVSGRFEGRSKHDMEILMGGRGAHISTLVNQHLQVLISSDPSTSKAQKATKLGITIINAADLDAALGGPLHDYKARMTRMATRYPTMRHLSTLAWGEPASEEELAKVETKIGFPLPAAFRSFFSQANGLSMVLYTPKKQRQKAPEVKTDLIPWDVAAHQDGPLWKELQKVSSSAGSICIPSLETIFFSDWSSMGITAENPKGTIKVGKRKVKQAEFFENLYLFDAFHGYYQAAIWVDKKNEALWVMLGEDYGAVWHDNHPIPFETYMEELVFHTGFQRSVQNINTKGWGQLRLTL